MRLLNIYFIQDGDKFWKLPECKLICGVPYGQVFIVSLAGYIRGNSIKYLRIPDEIIDLTPEQEEREGIFCCQFSNMIFNFFSAKIPFRGGRGGGRGGRGEGKFIMTISHL